SAKSGEWLIVRPERSKRRFDSRPPLVRSTDTILFAGITTPILVDGTNATYAEKPFVEPVLSAPASWRGGCGDLSDARGENDA
ncbi:hypothetical protein AAHH79_36460, partial [Burkholderia pseudomallei]